MTGIDHNSISSIFPSTQVMSKYFREVPKKGTVEFHEYVSINGGFPHHNIHYKIYTPQGQIEESKPINIDVRV